MFIDILLIIGIFYSLYTFVKIKEEDVSILVIPVIFGILFASLFTIRN